MATPTYDPIASTTLTLPALSVTFSSLDTIAAGYRDLVLVSSVKSLANGTFRTSFNGITTGIISYVSMNGNGSSAYSASSSSQSYFQDSYTDTPTDRFAVYLNQIFDFATTDKHKSMLMRSNRDDYNVAAIAGRWGSTSAITSIELAVFGTSFVSGSTFSLYGIAA